VVQSKVKSVSKSCYDRRPVNQYALVPSPLDIKGVPSENFQFDIALVSLCVLLFMVVVKGGGGWGVYGRCRYYGGILFVLFV
jgi:hypothetical protein